MLHLLIYELNQNIFEFLNIDELLKIKILSKYVNTTCRFDFLLNNKCDSNNVNNWYKLNHHLKDIVSDKLPSWRSRNKKWMTYNINRRYKYGLLVEINSILDNDLIDENPNYQTHSILRCIRYKINMWKIFDNDNLLGKLIIKQFPNRFTTKLTMYRLCGSIWFQIEYFNTNGKPRRFCVKKFNSLPWENSENIEDNLILNNNYNFEKQRIVTSNSIKRTAISYRYSLKFHNIKATQASIKNNVIDNLNTDNNNRYKHIFELGKTNEGFKYGYIKPLHGLYAFIIACSQFIF